VFLSIFPNRPKDTPQRLREFYFNNASRIDPTESFEGLAEIHAARFFLVSAHHTAKFHAKHAPVYLYYYNYPTEFGFLKLMHSLRGRYLPVVETAYEIVWHWVQKILGLEIHRRGKFSLINRRSMKLCRNRKLQRIFYYIPLQEFHMEKRCCFSSISPLSLVLLLALPITKSQKI
jgi:hypothetical protein